MLTPYLPQGRGTRAAAPLLAGCVSCYGTSQHGRGLVKASVGEGRERSVDKAEVTVFCNLGMGPRPLSSAGSRWQWLCGRWASWGRHRTS